MLGRSFARYLSPANCHLRPTPRWLAGLATLCLLGSLAAATYAAPREREPNTSYAERRAALRQQVHGPVVLFGYTGRENDSPSYVFNQEEYFYYLTGHNEEGAAIVLVPDAPNGRSYNGPREILFLPPHNRRVEAYNGPRMAPGDANLPERTGFAEIKPFASLRGELESLAKVFSTFYTLLPESNSAGYPHREAWHAWLKQALPNAQFADAGAPLGAMRQIKSESEMKLLTRAIELSMDAHLEAMRMMRPGLWEYEVAAKMEYVHKAGGCEAEGYAPIVGAGFNSTVLHYANPVQQIADGEIVVLDVACQYSGYTADITRTLPANGKFSPRQREIYEIVLAAQNAVLAALKPGMNLGGAGENSLQRIAMDYINSHGQDQHGQPLGKYYIHGLGHHIGLRVHDVGEPFRPLAPGMVVTIEPGIYIPEENLGVRIEDIVLITDTGYKLLTARLPRTIADVERTMRAGIVPADLEEKWLAQMPVYPPLARQARVQGAVLVDVEIGSDGGIRSSSFDRVTLCLNPPSVRRSGGGRFLSRISSENSRLPSIFELATGRMACMDTRRPSPCSTPIIS